MEYRWMKGDIMIMISNIIERHTDMPRLQTNLVLAIITVVLLASCAVDSPVPGPEHNTQSLPLGLDSTNIHIPDDNPMTELKIELGRLLFFDKRLSIDNTTACASCHSPATGFSDGKIVAVGIEGRQGPRNSPSIINRVSNSTQMWDGRLGSLEEQAKGPIVNPLEMGMPSLDAVVAKIGAIKGYQQLFDEAFGESVNIDTMTKAIASFERTILSGDSKWDRYQAGDESALSKKEKRGLELFDGKARCNQCHSGWNFTDEKFHNIGIGWDKRVVDMGRFMATGVDSDRGAFKTPSLRDTDATAPYMHDGRFYTLEEVIEYYNDGAIQNPYLDPEMVRPDLTLEETLERYSSGDDTKPLPVKLLNLTSRERDDLLSFLLALSGRGWQQIQPPPSYPR